MKNKMRIHLRRVVALSLSLAMLISLTGCKKEDPPIIEQSMVVEDANDAITKLAEARADYGYENALSELTEQSSVTVDGDNYYRLQQNYQGIPVYGRTVVCATDNNGSVISLTGNVLDITNEVELTPTINLDQVESSINSFYMDEYGYVPDNLSIDSLNTSDLCIYQERDLDETYLAFCVYVGAYEFVVDAHSGKLLSTCLTLFEDGTESVDGHIESDASKTFPVEKLSENNYIMYDSSRKLKVYTLNYQPSGNGSGIDHSLAELVQSADNIFGNTNEERTLEYEKGASLYQKSILIHDYFEALNFNPLVDSVYLYYNDRFDNGENALGGILSIEGQLTGVVSMGSERDAIDIVGHEYTHYVSRNIVNWKGSNETGALNEAMSDLFGELLESAYNSAVNQESVDPDWEHGSRNMVDPSINNYPAKVTDSNRSGEDYSHGYSTVITHAAYLMWNGIDGTDSKKINTNELAEIWYRAMLMMPSDCDFNDCRQIVELSATSMELTTAQINCVSEAFDAVGITGYSDEDDSDATYKVGLNGILKVYGGNGELCGNYTLVMAQKKLINLGSGGVRITRHITSAEPYDLAGLSEGKYTFSITDSANTNNSITFTVSVKEKYDSSSVEVFTNFGCTPVKGTVSEIKEVNGVNTNIPVTNAVVKIYSHAQESVVETILMSETEGFFEVYLPIGAYSFAVEAEGYISSTTSFEVTAEHSEYLEIILQPDMQKQLSSIVTYQDGKESEEYHFTYNDLGQVIGMVAYRYEDGNAIKWYTQNYEYDEKGNLVLVEHGSSQSYLYQYDYDADGQIIGYSSIEYYEDSPGPSDSYIFSYDNQGRIIERRNEYGSSVEEFSYDESGKIVYESSDLYWGDGHFVGKTEYDYTYAPLVISTSTSESKEYGNSSSKSISFKPHWNLTLASGTIHDSCSFDVDSSGCLLRVIDANGNNVYVCNYQEALTDNSEYVDWYKQVLQTHPEATKHSYTSGGEVREYQYETAYTLYDIDKDGIPELIVQEDLSNYYVYTMSNSGASLCGKFYWSYADCLYAYDGNGIVVHDGGIGSMRLEYLWLYELSGEVLDSSGYLVSTEESSEDALYDQLKQYERITNFVPITDYSLLGNN